MPKPFSALEAFLDYSFKTTSLLDEALTHPSRTSRKGKQAPRDYQRLEFLGDAVLGLVVAEMLYLLYPEEREGDLARRKAALVAGPQLVGIAESWGLGDYLHLSGRAEAEGGRKIATNMEDACEAVLGAIYLDGGFYAAQAVIIRFWKPLAEAVRRPPKDPKTRLQEWAQARALPLPAYNVVAQDGPAHNPIFTLEVAVDGQKPCLAVGGSKREATTKAAEMMLDQIRKSGSTQQTGGAAIPAATPSQITDQSQTSGSSNG